MGEALPSSFSDSFKTGRDPPLDAIVLDRSSADAHGPIGEALVYSGPALAPQWRHPPAAAKVYVVPKRFGVSGIMALTTGMAFLFGFLRLLDAHPIVFLFLGCMALVICVVQMFFGDVPRKASIAAGAVLWPLLAVTAAVIGGAPPVAVACSAFSAVLLGAGMGYIVGTCVAGVFLVMERVDPYLPGGRERAAKLGLEPAANNQEGSDGRSPGEDAVSRRAGL